jgi:hypothetical protein
MSLAKIPECRVNIVAHHIQPEETDQNARIGHETDCLAEIFVTVQTQSMQIYQSKIDIQKNQTETVAHQTFSVKVLKFIDASVDQESHEKKGN